MAGLRKLNGEIERCLKQVAERVEIFNDVWDKVQSASNSNQKEKYEADLKKEIKKLQRLRDQIKTWLASSDVKAQRTTLMENRRLIEVQMERFKIIERETKTKAFSKEGLAAAAKVDPRQKERNETREWLNNCADELKQQVEQLEAEIEQLSAGKKKKSKSADERESTLNETIERHTFHITKFEMLMRLLDKGEHEGLDRQIKEILEDDIRYYIDENTDPDFAENEYMYDDFNEVLEGGMPVVDHAAIEAAKKAEEEEKRQEFERLKKIKEKKAAAEKKAKEDADAKLKEKQAKAAAAKAKAEAAKVASNSNQGLVAVGGRVGKQQPGDAPPAQPRIPAGGINFAAAASSAAAAAAPKVTSPAGAVSPGNGSWGSSAPAQQGPAAVQQGGSTPGGAYPNRGVPPGQGARPGGPGSAPSGPQGGVRPPQGGGTPGVGTPGMGTPGMGTPGMGTPGGGGGGGGGGTPGMSTPGGAGEPPAGTMARSLQLLSTASVLLPEQQEQTRSYTPANPHPTPASYPNRPPAHFNQPSFYATMDTDTLLFIFYYQQGTYQQYLAARELKKQAWRFHKKYLTWFQRHEEPKIITDEYEQGTYVYFDFEAGWCQRKKTDFTFEYRFLEDHDLP